MGKGYQGQRNALNENLKKEHLAKCKAFAEKMEVNTKETRAKCLEMEKERKAKTAQSSAQHLAKHAWYVG